ncbi:MAG: hypothetical protein ACI8ZM_005318 [Crocinitomix sp.]|jgi:hypothetical protein
MMRHTINTAWVVLQQFLFMVTRTLIIFFALLCAGSTFSQKADSTIVLSHFDKILDTDGPRDHLNTKALNKVAAYIHEVFEQYADSTNYQNYEVGDKTYKNVIGSFGTEHENRIIIGAHYDVCGNQDGADDNASGVVGLLELARLLKGQKLNARIDLVGYSLEEPPYFRSKNMGSYVHAKWLHDSEIKVDGMICLEMIGYFNDAKKSQDYPLGILKMFYGGKGDYITVVSKFSRGKFARQYKRKMKKNKNVKTKAFQAPGKLPGIDFSDHLNYWKFGYSAVMITNTGFYRNKNYHHDTDKLETLDISRMTGVIQSVYETVSEITQPKE